jgi:HEAT repeat protein
MRERYERNTKGANIDDFVRNLNSDDPEKRLEGIKSLQETQDEKVVEYLLQALGDPDMRIKAKAIDALGNVRATEATPVLIQHLFLRDTETYVKQRILASLGKIGDQRAAGPIIEFLRRDLDPDVRGTGIFALGEIGATESLEYLEDVEESDANATLRRLAREATRKVKHHQSLLQVEAKEPATNFLRSERAPAP